MTSRGKPAHVAVLALGGTIASVPSGSAGEASPRLGGHDLLAALDGFLDDVDLEVEDVLTVPSNRITLDDVVKVAHLIQDRMRAGAHAAVVVQGTDTMEETAFGLDLLVGGGVVVTGAMRGPAVPGSDGPANLLAAIRVATLRGITRLGSLVVMGDEVHAARFVVKADTARPSAFRSPGTGPIGWVTESRPQVVMRPLSSPRLVVPRGAIIPPIALLTSSMGDRGEALEALRQADGVAGVVVEALGGGHLPPGALDAVAEMARRVPVVIASRAGAGSLLRTSYDYPGSEIDLARRGIISSGYLDGPKSRVLLALALAAGHGRARLRSDFVRAARAEPVLGGGLDRRTAA